MSRARRFGENRSVRAHEIGDCVSVLPLIRTPLRARLIDAVCSLRVRDGRRRVCSGLVASFDFFARHPPLLQLVKDLRTTFASGRTLPVEYRKEQLTKLRDLLTENDEALCEAVYKDLRKVSALWISLIVLIIKCDRPTLFIYILPYRCT